MTYSFPITFDSRADLEAYKSRSFPLEYLVNYPSDLGELLEGMSPGEYSPPKIPPAMVPATAGPLAESFQPVTAGGATSAERNPPRFTAPGGAVSSTVRDEVAKISGGSRRPAVEVSTRPSVSTAAPATVPTGPRILNRTEFSAPEPTPPKGYSPLETFPIPAPTIETGAEPNPPRVYRTSEFFPVASTPAAAEPTPPRFEAPPVASAPPPLPAWTAPPAAAEPDPPRYTAPDPAPAAVTPPAETESPWDAAKRLFGEWWTKPGIWDRVKEAFGGELPKDPNAAPTRPPPVLQSNPPTSPDPTTPDPTVPVPTPTDTTPAAESSGNDIDRYLASLDGVMTNVGKLLDVFTPGAGSTAPPNTAAAEKPKPNTGAASPLAGIPAWGWGGLALLLLFLASKKR